ncbi:MAG: hypothetical protein Q4F17_12010 [Eubacteriales bacterium]|nr:hypothetical protein [Eubacteriales bacterium]
MKRENGLPHQLASWLAMTDTALKIYLTSSGKITCFAGFPEDFLFVRSKIKKGVVSWNKMM